MVMAAATSETIDAVLESTRLCTTVYRRRRWKDTAKPTHKLENNNYKSNSWYMPEKKKRSVEPWFK